jgi:hypothetical protein
MLRKIFLKVRNIGKLGIYQKTLYFKNILYLNLGKMLSSLGLD